MASLELVIVWSHVFVPLDAPVTVPPPVAKSAQVRAVLNSESVPVIHTIEVWSHVLVPLNVPVAQSAIVIPLFCIILPVVESYRAIALSVELAGQCTSPVPSQTATSGSHGVPAPVTVTQSTEI